MLKNGIANISMLWYSENVLFIIEFFILSENYFIASLYFVNLKFPIQIYFNVVGLYGHKRKLI